jgi:hypothetical protein
VPQRASIRRHWQPELRFQAFCLGLISRALLPQAISLILTRCCCRYVAALTSKSAQLIDFPP